MRVHVPLVIATVLAGAGLSAAGLSFATTPVAGTAAEVQDIPEVLQRSRALYPTLKTYADTGTVTTERPGLVGTARFRTYFRQPTDFYFEYFDHSSVSAGYKLELPTHHVLWMLKGELETWNASSKAHDLYPRAEGRQVSALVGAGAGTEMTAVLISSLVFLKANINGPVQELVQATVAGDEVVGNRRCHKVTGTARSVYPSGAVTNIRPMTVWIDAETLLIRKVFEDTPKGYPASSFARRTITYEPQANVPLDDAKFRFKVPSAQ